MTTPLTPETEAGRRLAKQIASWTENPEKYVAVIVAIEAEARERRERVDPDPETGRMALALRSLGLTDEQVRRVRTDEGDWLANTTPGERVDPDLRAALNEVESRHRQGDWTEEGWVGNSVNGIECNGCGEPWPCSATRLRLAATPDHTVGEEERCACGHLNATCDLPPRATPRPR